MEGTLTYWYNGEPIVLDAYGNLTYWFEGAPYCYVAGVALTGEAEGLSASTGSIAGLLTLQMEGLGEAQASGTAQALLQIIGAATGLSQSTGAASIRLALFTQALGLSTTLGEALALLGLCGAAQATGEGSGQANGLLALLAAASGLTATTGAGAPGLARLLYLYSDLYLGQRMLDYVLSERDTAMPVGAR